LARRLAGSPQGSFPQSLKPAELKAAYRFFDNTQIDIDGILAPHIAQTLDRMRQVPVVLAIQDTTEFNLSLARTLKRQLRPDNRRSCHIGSVPSSGHRPLRSRPERM
jgi:hypothetical protein